MDWKKVFQKAKQQDKINDFNRVAELVKELYFIFENISCGRKNDTNPLHLKTFIACSIFLKYHRITVSVYGVCMYMIARYGSKTPLSIVPK